MSDVSRCMARAPQRHGTNLNAVSSLQLVTKASSNEMTPMPLPHAGYSNLVDTDATLHLASAARRSRSMLRVCVRARVHKLA